MLKSYEKEIKIPVKVIQGIKEIPPLNLFRELRKKYLLNLTALFVIVGLNWIGLFAISDTSSYFIDEETSKNNKFEVGILDFAVDSDSESQPICANEEEKSEREITISNLGNPFWYTVSADDFSSDICDYVNLEANLDGGEIEYSGKLNEFAYGPIVFADPEVWKMTLSLDSEIPEELQSENCEFKFVFSGYQTKNDLPFGTGFSDREEADVSIANKICEERETRTMGYWKNHSEVFEPHLPVDLGKNTINSVEEALAIFENASGKDMKNMLKAQLLALKFNVAHFDIGEYVYEGQSLDEIIKAADALLKAEPEPNKDILENMKDLIDEINNLEKIDFCWCGNSGYEPAQIDEPVPEDDKKLKKDELILPESILFPIVTNLDSADGGMVLKENAIGEEGAIDDLPKVNEPSADEPVGEIKESDPVIEPIDVPVEETPPDEEIL